MVAAAYAVAADHIRIRPLHVIRGFQRHSQQALAQIWDCLFDEIEYSLSERLLGSLPFSRGNRTGSIASDLARNGSDVHAHDMLPRGCARWIDVRSLAHDQKRTNREFT